MNELFWVGFVLLGAALVFWDIKYLYLPDVLVAGVLVLGLLKITLTHADFTPALLSAALLGLGTFLLKTLYVRLQGRQGLGLGDVKLFAALGVWIAPLDIPLFLMYVGACGALWGLASSQERFPFAPALYGGFFLCILTKACNFF